MANRLHEIDGIRGWAALVVVVFHFSWELFGHVFPAIKIWWLQFFFDGPLAVFVFFVLSGDALSNGYVRTGNDRQLARMALKRYFRLAGPILLSCVLVYLALRAGIAFHEEASEVLGLSHWLGSFLPFEPSLPRMVKYGLLQVFTDHSVAMSYNPFLWPMAIELYGSFFVFALLFTLRQLPRPLVVVGCAAGFFFVLGSFFSLFFTGMIFAMLREQGFFERARAHRWSALSFAGVALVMAADALIGLRGSRPPQMAIAMAVLLVFSIYCNRSLIAFFSNRLSRYLGRISFPLYISHFVVLISFASWLSVQAHARGVLTLGTALQIGAASIAVSLIVAEVVTRIEAWYLKRLDRVVNRWLQPQSGVAPQSPAKPDPYARNRG